MDETELNVAGFKNVGFVLERVTSVHKKTLDDLISLWKEIYEFSDQLKCDLLKQFMKYVEDHCDQMVESQKERKMEIEKEISQLMNEKMSLEKELNIDIDLNNTHLLNKPLKVQLILLNKKLSKYKIEKEKKMKQFQLLIDQENDLCQTLGVTSRYEIDHKKVPNDIETNRYRKHIDQLIIEKDQRLKYYIQVKKKLIKTLEALETEAKTRLEEEILNENENNLILNDEKINELKCLEKKLEESMKTALDKKESLIGRLKYLWNRIEFDPGLQNEFLNNNYKLGDKTINNILNEITRSEMILKDNLESIIKKLRIEIQLMWTKLTYTEEEKKRFHPHLKWQDDYYDDNYYSEELLNIYEQELDKLNKYYSNYKEIFELAEKRKYFFEKLNQLEMAANDKNRLFNNRGGRLLKEEKERKLIDNNLPKIEKQLEQLLINHIERENFKFLWHGEDLLDKLTRDWELRLQPQSIEHKKAPKDRTDAGRIKTPRGALKEIKMNSVQSDELMPPSPFASSSQSLATMMKQDEDYGTTIKTPVNTKGYGGLATGRQPNQSTKKNNLTPNHNNFKPFTK